MLFLDKNKNKVSSRNSNISIKNDIRVGNIVFLTYNVGFFKYVFRGMCVKKSNSINNVNYTLYLFRDYGFELSILLILNIYYVNGWYLKVEYKVSMKNILGNPLKRLGYRSFRKYWSF